MRFAKHLRDIGDEFRANNLESTDEKDKTETTEDWRDMKVRLSADKIIFLIWGWTKKKLLE